MVIGHWSFDKGLNALRFGVAIFIFCPPLGWTAANCLDHLRAHKRQLSELGTGNSVSAAFYHGGKLAGILAVLSEAFKELPP